MWRDLEHHGYLRVDVRPEELRGDWIAVDPGVEPLRPTVIASWAVGPELPVVLRESTPSSSVTAFADVRRPGLPLDVLPVPGRPPERPAARSGPAAAGRPRWPALAGSAVGLGLVVRRRVRSRRRRRG